MRQTEGLYRFSRLFIQLIVGAAAIAAGLAIFTYIFFLRSLNLPEALALAERELATGTLRFGERIDRAARVYVRRPSDYFRAANGVLAATSERLIFIGVAPLGTAQNPDAPPVLIQQEFANDTLLSVEPQRVFFGSSRGVVVERADRAIQFGATGRHWHELEDLASYVTAVQQAQRRAAARERRIRQAVERIEAQPIRYTVRPGDAISTIANWFGVSMEELQRWNDIEGTRIRIGETLLVRRGRAAADP